MDGKIISWQSKKQTCVSLSTVEAEYIAADLCTSQIIWIQSQLREYEISMKKNPLYCDSDYVICICHIPAQHFIVTQIVHLSLAQVVIGLAMIMVCTTSLKLTGICFSSIDFLARFLGWIPGIEGYSIPGQNRHWMVRMAEWSDHVASDISALWHAHEAHYQVSLVLSIVTWEC